MAKMTESEKKIWTREIIATFVAALVCSLFVKKISHGSFMWWDSLKLAFTIGVGVPVATIGMRSIFQRRK